MRLGRALIVRVTCATIFIGSAIGFGLWLEVQADQTPSRGNALFFASHRAPPGGAVADPLHDSMVALLSRSHLPRSVQTNLSLSAFGTGTYRLTAVAVAHMSAQDPIMAGFLNGGLVADTDTDDIFGKVNAPYIVGGASDPDAESITINSLGPVATVTRDQVWTFSTSNVPILIGWTSADKVVSDDQPDNKNIPKVNDTATSVLHLSDTRLLAYEGTGSPQIYDSTISFSRAGRALMAFELATSSTNDLYITSLRWPCDLSNASDCFYITSSDVGVYDSSFYTPDSITQIFELAMALAAAGPIIFGLRQVRPWRPRLRVGSLPLAVGATLVTVGTGLGYIAAVITSQDVYTVFDDARANFIYFSLYSVIVLYVAYGSIEWLRWTIMLISVTAMAGDVAYLYAAYRVGLLGTVLLAALGVTVICGSLFIRRSWKAAIAFCAVTVAANLETSTWGGVRTSQIDWLGRLPFAFKYLQETWIPICVSLASVAAIDMYLRHRGLRRWRFFDLIYPTAGLLALVPDVIFHPNINHSHYLYHRPYDYWLVWWAALSVFTAFALIRLSTTGRTADCYREPQVRRYSVAVLAIICMMLFYSGYSSQYKSGVVAIVAIASLAIALPTRDIDRAVELAQSTAKSHAKATARYVRARELTAAYKQLKRDEAASLAGGKLSVSAFDARAEELLLAVNTQGGVSAAARRRVFGVLFDESPAHAGAIAAMIALVASVPIVLFDLTGLPEHFVGTITQAPLITSLWQAIALERWGFYGFLFGFFYPLLRGTTSMLKACGMAIALLPTELSLTWISNTHVRPETLFLAVGETIAFFLVLGAAWEVRLLARSGIAWTAVRGLRGMRGLVAPLGAVAVAAVTAAVPVLTNALAPTSPQPAQQQVQLNGRSTSTTQRETNTQTPVPDTSDSGVAWPTGAETKLPCGLPTPAPSATAESSPPADACAAAQSPTS